MKQLKIAPLVSILLYWPIIICWPTNRLLPKPAIGEWIETEPLRQPSFLHPLSPLHNSTPSLRTTFTAATKIIDIRGRSSMDAQRDGDVSRPGEGSPLLQTQQRENHTHNPDLEKPNSKYTTYAVALGVLLA